MGNLVESVKETIEGIKGTINNWWVYLVAGILFIATGVVVFCNPVESYVGLSMMFGIMLFMVGILRTGAAASTRAINKNWGWDLAFGIIEIVLGIVLVIHPEITVVTLPIIFGFWLLIMGVYLIAFSFQLKEYKVQGWGWTLAGAILTVILSVMVICNLSAGAFTIVFLTGIALFVGGLFYIMLAFRLRSLKKKAEELNPFKDNK